jgi:hypothetical protein
MSGLLRANFRLEVQAEPAAKQSAEREPQAV